ncbi:MAG TPA: ribose 5-phosphate isomerase B [Anaerolineaceae bacterium]|nr:ribose 5-phosphate isomerase B [Anaerolineaceae bacterium]
MNGIPDDEIHAIVQRVLSRTLGHPPPSPESTPTQPDKPSPPRVVVAIGADHGGFDLKEILKKDLANWGFEIIDVGTHSKDPVDYPDLAHEVACLVRSGKAARGIMIDGAGIGSCMVANKVPGVRAAMAYDHATAVNSREHNDANLLTLGAGLIGVNLAKQIVQTWLTTEHAGGRHAKRVEKITAVEKQYLK